MPMIAGISLVVERLHNKYVSVILIRDDLKVYNVYERVQGTVELITIVMSGVVVHPVTSPQTTSLRSQHSATEICHT